MALNSGPKTEWICSRGTSEGLVHSDAQGRTP